MIAPQAPPPDIAPVFISFASEELQLAQRIVEQLERSGIRCWIASRDIEVGASYPAAITAAVTHGSAMLLLLTAASNASPHVLSEVELAFNARKPILPLRLTPVALSADLQYFLGTTQWFDVGTEFDDDEAARLQARLRHVIAHKVPFDDTRRTGPTRSKQWLAYTAAAVALLAAIGAMVIRNRRATSAASPAGVVASRPESIAGSPAPTRDSPPPPAPAVPDASAKTDDSSSHLRMRVNTKSAQPYVWIPPGLLTVGCSPGDSSCDKDEFPSHLVRIRQGFWMSRTEVTNAQYAKGRGRAGRATDGDLPATGLDWREAKAYCAAVGGRLPTEAEWEYAARAGSTSSGYDVLADIAWYAGNSDGRPHPVGQKTPNAFGLFDMLGNVSEWVADRYFNTYGDTEAESLADPIPGNASGVVRGGGFGSEAKALRVSNRFEREPDAQDPMVGVRCVADR